MSQKAVSDRLRALASDEKKRSKTARLREVYDEVENALAAGVTQASVVEALKEAGLEMTLTSFRNTLQRIRTKRGGKPTMPVAGSPAKPAQPQAKTNFQQPAKPDPLKPMIEEEVITPSASHNPKDIDNIMGATPDLDALAKIGRSKKP